jgi:Domain of unknown function (DUF4258)
MRPVEEIDTPALPLNPALRFGPALLDILSILSIYTAGQTRGAVGMRRTQPLYGRETAILHRVARSPNCRIDWSRHALEQMKERSILASDVINALMKGQVILEELKADVLWRVEGRDLDSAPLRVVVAVYEEAIKIKVVTTF